MSVTRIGPIVPLPLLFKLPIIRCLAGGFAAETGVMNAPFAWLSQADRHFKGTNG